MHSSVQATEKTPETTLSGTTGVVQLFRTPGLSKAATQKLLREVSAAGKRWCPQSLRLFFPIKLSRLCSIGSD